MRLSLLDMNSAAYDQSGGSGPTPRKVLLVGPPRTGSTTLCRMMFTSGIGVPHEYFNEIFFTTLCERFGVPLVGPPLAQPAEFWTQYLQALLARRSRCGLFAAKIQYKQYHLFLQNSIGDALLEDAVIIYLTRQDVLAQAVSWHCAEITGQWDFDQTVITRPHPQRNFFDKTAIDFYIREIVAEQRLWERLFSQKNIVPLRISSMELHQGPLKILQSIADRVGIAHSQLQCDEARQTRYDSDPRYPSKRAIMEFWVRERNVAINRLPSTTVPARASSA